MPMGYSASIFTVELLKPDTMTDNHTPINPPTLSNTGLTKLNWFSLAILLFFIYRSIKERDENIERLQQRLAIERFGVERFSKDDSMIMFYTGFMTFSVFTTVFEFIKPAATSMTSHYFKMSAIGNPNLTGRQRNMLLIDEFFMFLCRLKCGMMAQDRS